MQCVEFVLLRLVHAVVRAAVWLRDTIRGEMCHVLSSYLLSSCPMCGIAPLRGDDITHLITPQHHLTSAHRAACVVLPHVVVSRAIWGGRSRRDNRPSHRITATSQTTLCATPHMRRDLTTLYHEMMTHRCYAAAPHRLISC